MGERRQRGPPRCSPTLSPTGVQAPGARAGAGGCARLLSTCLSLHFSCPRRREVCSAFCTQEDGFSAWLGQRQSPAQPPARVLGLLLSAPQQLSICSGSGPAEQAARRCQRKEEVSSGAAPGSGSPAAGGAGPPGAGAEAGAARGGAGTFQPAAPLPAASTHPWRSAGRRVQEPPQGRAGRWAPPLRGPGSEPGKQPAGG